MRLMRFSLVPLLIYCFLIAVHGYTFKNTSQDLPSNILVTSPESPFVQIPGVMPSYNALVAMDVLRLVSSLLDIDLSFTHPSDFRFGGLTNGQWDGIIGQLLKKEADLGGSLNAITYLRFTAVDFAFPVLFDVTGILIPFPEESTKVFAVFQPFEIEVWGALTVSFILLCVFLTVAANRETQNWKHAGDHFMWLVSVITGKGTEFLESSLAVRLAGGTWCLACIVFFYVYKGVLTAKLASPGYKPVINSLNELATSSVIQPATIKSTAVDDLMLSSLNGTYKMIGDKFRLNPNSTLIGNVATGVERAASGSFAFLEPRMSLLSLMENDYKNFNRCRVTLAKDSFYPRAFAYLLPKKSPVKESFDATILFLHQFGFVEHSKKSHGGRRGMDGIACLMQNANKVKKIQRMNFNQISSALYFVLFVGYFASFATFLIENIIHKTKNH